MSASTTTASCTSRTMTLATNNFIEIVRSQTLVPSANYFAAVKLLEGDVKITHTPTVAAGC